MSMPASAKLKQVATDAPEKRPATIAGLLTDPKVKEQMALALPRHMTADRLARIALTEVRKNPMLASCDQASFLGAIMQCAALGLEPGGALGHAYMIPFRNNKKQIVEVQFIVGYRGMIDLARRSGQILSIEARTVYEQDHFHIRYGLESTLEHTPNLDVSDRGKLRYVYAVAKLKDGGVQFDCMGMSEVESIRAQSRAATNGPWVSHFEEMAKKTVIRRLFKYLPVSIEMQRAVGLDEQADMGIQTNSLDMVGAEIDITEISREIDEEFTPPPMTAQSLMDRMHKTNDIDVLDADATLISQLPDEDQAGVLSVYEIRKQTLIEKGSK
ncbi:MAG: recombination protein RecT [Betaproteobacteria bacterium]